MSKALLSIHKLQTYFFTLRGVVKAVDSVSFEIREGETLGLVGESGSGKTTTALSIVRLVPDPGKIVNGEIFFRGEDLLKKSKSEMQKIRGAKIAMSFQDPMTSLNPVIPVGKQVAECFTAHQGLNKSEAMKETIETLRMVGIASPSERAKDYPFQLSGGMRQRILIATAISCRPELMITDEPTTALDVIVQSQVLDLLRELKKKLGLSQLLVTHDLGIVAEVCDTVAIMYAGKILEYASAETIFPSRSKSNPMHPYTIGLLRSIPKLDKVDRRLMAIKGMAPDMINPPAGCKFHPRCSYAKEICSEESPQLEEVDKEHFVACFHSEGISNC